MSVVRINEFRARPGAGDGLMELIRSFKDAISTSPGCLSCDVLRARDDADRIVVLERWESEAAHQAATKSIPPDAMKRAMELLAEPPTGDYFQNH